MDTLVTGKGTLRRFAFTPVLFAVVIFAFMGIVGLDFLHSWPAAERGMLLFERACPIYATARSTT